jgi:Pyridoxamine 5'-phosphate oxidase
MEKLMTITNSGPGQRSNTAGSATVDRDPAQVGRIARAINSRYFATMATVSPKGVPHVAGVIYCPVGTTLYIHTMRTSRKARNIASSGMAAIVIPIRKLPVGPPFSVQFQGDADLLDMDDPIILNLLKAKKLKRIAGHGALDEPDGVFVRVSPTRVVHSYGIGVSTIGLIKDPLHAGARSVELS